MNTVLNDQEQDSFIQNDTRFQIWGLLSIYPELSYSDICKKLKKSKSTLHPHIQKLLELKIIEVIREEKVRGSILAKIYTLTNRAENKIIQCGIGDNCPSIVTGEVGSSIMDETFSSRIDDVLSQKIIRGEKNIELYNKNLILLKLRFYEKLSYSDRATEIIAQIFANQESFNSIIFLTASQYRKTRDLFSSLLEDLNQIIKNDEQSNEIEERPYVFLASAFKMKHIFDINI